MITYEERRDSLAIKSSILVQVMLGDARGDLEFSLVHPRPANAAAMEEELKARWHGRGLRAVGFIGLVAGAPQLVLKEPIDEDEVQALALAFGVYVGTLVKHAATGGYLAAEIERAEGAELERNHMERICALPDPRTEYGPN